MLLVVLFLKKSSLSNVKKAILSTIIIIFCSFTSFMIFTSEQWELLQKSHGLIHVIIGVNLTLLIPLISILVFSIRVKKVKKYILIPCSLGIILTWFDYMVLDLIFYFLLNHELQNCIHIISCNGHSNHLLDLWLNHLKSLKSSHLG